jgi:hypothetical protein
VRVVTRVPSGGQSIVAFIGFEIIAADAARKHFG